MIRLDHETVVSHVGAGLADVVAAAIDPEPGLRPGAAELARLFYDAVRPEPGGGRGRLRRGLGTDPPAPRRRRPRPLRHPSPTRGAGPGGSSSSAAVAAPLLAASGLGAGGAGARRTPVSQPRRRPGRNPNGNRLGAARPAPVAPPPAPAADRVLHDADESGCAGRGAAAGPERPSRRRAGRPRRGCAGGRPRTWFAEPRQRPDPHLGAQGRPHPVGGASARGGRGRVRLRVALGGGGARPGRLDGIRRRHRRRAPASTGPPMSGVSSTSASCAEPQGWRISAISAAPAT